MAAIQVATASVIKVSGGYIGTYMHKKYFTKDEVPI